MIFQRFGVGVTGSISSKLNLLGADAARAAEAARLLEEGKQEKVLPPPKIRCQAWKLPVVESKITLVGKRIAHHYAVERHDIFCPACNCCFVDFHEYQSHLIIKEAEEEIKEKIRIFTAEQGHKARQMESIFERHGKYAESRSARRKSRLKSVDWSNWSYHMDQVQAEINTEESDSYRDPSYKFATGDGQTEKRMYKREAAIEEYKRIRALFTDLKHRKYLREMMNKNEHNGYFALPSIANGNKRITFTENTDSDTSVY
ncbi:Oidioi.mRNA.OKI2018_I69.XSR.g15171.t1.cds [Oikopleura dioica]|uniref:Oidioi.mRNA.OKI2018_I69.XSR.g15171.t1.cds n=1 Tax=Oikopleura dioica TaxID=34765 RepID=A0ABN7SC04_OIKDI|nr:Oidioi.mRNA.OKI2018_I69.XSR.g15171.t1.cds [Oikopleura dioica]